MFWGAGRGLLLAVVLAMSPAMVSAQSLPQRDAAKPLVPGGIRIISRNPLPGNWVCKNGQCACKPLACGEAAMVSYKAAPTPARKPDRQALERFAKTQVPKSLKALGAARAVLSDGRDKLDVLQTGVTAYQGYQGVLAEAKLSSGKGKPLFLAQASIFAGPVLVTVNSISVDRAVAKRALNEYIAAMSFIEGPSLSPAPDRPAMPPEHVVPPTRQSVPDANRI